MPQNGNQNDALHQAAGKPGPFTHAQHDIFGKLHHETKRSLRVDSGVVVLRMACGHGIQTKFTDVDHAVDYIQRSSFVAIT